MYIEKGKEAHDAEFILGFETYEEANAARIALETIMDYKEEDYKE